MASEVDIANLALGHLGDTANISSFTEGSAQATHCARFYPIARDALLEMHAWGFCTKRVQLSLLVNTWPEWNYAYAQPSDALNILAVLPPNATDDISEAPQYTSGPRLSQFVPQPFVCEINESNQPVILTDQSEAVLRYTVKTVDTTKFSPLFVTTLAWHLASMIAGPILKGEVGAAEGKRCMAMMKEYLKEATESDAAQRRMSLQHTASWMAGR